MIWLSYTRTSTPNQRNNNTIEIQEKLIKEYCSGNNINISMRFSDSGISGIKGTEERPGLASLFEYVKKK
jgi:DNA invertase Pin-like site-specific DNA recombinase